MSPAHACMSDIRRFASLMVIGLSAPGLVGQAALAGENKNIETDHVQLVIGQPGTAGLASLRTLHPSRELLPAHSTTPLFRIVLIDSAGKPDRVDSSDAGRVTHAPFQGGTRTTWSGFVKHDLTVWTTISRDDGHQGLTMRIEVDNQTSLPIESVAYPMITCRLPLDENDLNEAVLFPRHEGTLLRQPHKCFTQVGQWETERYPGHVGFQFMAYYDGQGGLYLGAHDGDGYAKEFRVRRDETGLELSIIHLGLSPAGERWERPYPVVVDTFQGNWMDAADLYRGWARKQRWCARRIGERNVPSWVYEGAGFYNYPASISKDADIAFFPPHKAASALDRLRRDLQAPLVATPFSWEKCGVWIGPDYFPPRGGEQAYRQLIETLHSRGDRLFVFLSGFRWGLSKPGTEYNGEEAFERDGATLAVRNKNNEIVKDKRPWAHNALLCAGCQDARTLLADCFRRAYELGIDAVQLDQNVGGDVDVCYAASHGHPPGPGQWQANAMAGFLSEVRQIAREFGEDRIVTVEEPCEYFIQHLDAYHGRAFTYDNWPAIGRGSASVPVFLYLYHPYLPGYAGWTGGGFDVGHRVELSIGRAFIDGMLIGIRGNVWTSTLKPGKPATAFKMWRRAIQVQRRCADALLLGDMSRPPRLRGVTSRIVGERPPQGRGPRPDLSIDSVQAVTWITPDGQTVYAIANVEQQPAAIEIEIAGHGQSGQTRFNVIRVTADNQSPCAANVQRGSWIALTLAPFDVNCLRLEPIMAGEPAPVK